MEKQLKNLEKRAKITVRSLINGGKSKKEREYREKRLRKLEQETRNEMKKMKKEREDARRRVVRRKSPKRKNLQSEYMK